MERRSGIAVWRQIGESLAEEIRTNRYMPGTLLPSVSDLAARYDVNRHTIMRAIAELQQHGLVRVERGRGTFVESSMLQYPIGKRTRFTQTLRRQGVLGYVTVVQSDVVKNADIAHHLKLPRSAKLVHIRVLGKAEKTTISLSDNYFEQKRFPDFADILRETHSISAAYARYGIDDYVRQWSKVTAHLPEQDVARLLEQSRLRPILQVEALNADLKGAPLQYTVGSFVGDGVELLIGGE
ncbi:phosphonate metabolism transcriptional regulator PhnF [Burkholderia sp. ABCPW 14]|uniref:phosphonate metabolism transcriptional regulator PhnF n=1 Tax=Burkholderia sp. ABCPW 14 TaxID=1637860 RepID=UPI000770DB7E|nr:phosphonate metabolism transcriptional regulator PhnF [Burkholderia sp. ABCPW 14]KVD84437.1 phosphonate metabolism transcriptional regulator PhnF [Burkholderia sp. ABCPW 14]